MVCRVECAMRFDYYAWQRLWYLCSETRGAVNFRVRIAFIVPDGNRWPGTLNKYRYES